MEAVNLKTRFGFTSADKNRSLTEAGMSIAAAKSAFPDFYRNQSALGRSDADFLRNYCYVAGAMQCFFENDAHQNPQMPAGSGNIYFANGVPIVLNQQCWIPYGAMLGSGVFIEDKFDTVLSPEHNPARRVGDATKRNLLVSPSYGRNDLLGYHEAFLIDNIRLEGKKPGAWQDTSFESSGLIIWDAGESSKIDRIKSDWFNDFGVCLVRATPAHIGNLSAFGNSRSALGMIGTALGTIRVDVLTGDDNCALIEMLPGYGREAGGNLSVGSIKLETSTTPEGTWGAVHVWKGQLAGKLRGQYNVHIAELTYASPWIKSGQLFWVDERLTNGSLQQSRLEVRGKGFGFAALLVDSARGQYFDAPPDYSAWHAVYQGGKLWVNGVEQTPKPYPVGAGPMGFARAGQTLNFANATPQQQVTGTAPVPPPVTCTWVPGAPVLGPCVNGSQTVTTPYVSSVAGCVPTTAKPADVVTTQACGTTPPPTSTTIEPLNIATASTSIPVNISQSKTISLTGLLVPGTTLADFAYLMGGGGNGSRAIVLKKDGKWYDNRSGGDVLIPTTGGLVKAGTAWTGTLTLSSPWDFTYLGSFASGTPIGLKCTATKIVVSK